MSEESISAEMLTQLIRQLGHDMRAPLGSLLSTADMLVEGIYDPLTEKQARAVERMRRNGRRTIALLEDFVTFVKAEAGELVLQNGSFQPNTKLGEWCSEVRPVAEDKGLALHFIASANLPRQLIGDEPVIRRIVLALLWNAAAFTAEGQINVESAWEDNGCWVITVRDTGPGIPCDDQSHIFEPFWRGTARPQMPTAGAGLGLALAQALVKQMQGNVFLKQTSNSGSTFCVQLPLKQDLPAELSD